MRPANNILVGGMRAPAMEFDRGHLPMFPRRRAVEFRGNQTIDIDLPQPSLLEPYIHSTPAKFVHTLGSCAIDAAFETHVLKPDIHRSYYPNSAYALVTNELPALQSNVQVNYVSGAPWLTECLVELSQVANEAEARLGEVILRAGAFITDARPQIEPAAGGGVLIDHNLGEKIISVIIESDELLLSSLSSGRDIRVIIDTNIENFGRLLSNYIEELRS